MIWSICFRLLIASCLVSLMLLGHPRAVLGQTAGDEDPQRIDGLAGTLSFRYCPPGSYLRQNLKVPDAWSVNPEVRHIKQGFWIQETELSLEQYLAIQQFSVKRAQDVGNKSLSPLPTLNELSQRTGADKIFSDKAIQKQLPVTGLTLLEALGVSENLTIMMGGNLNGVSLTKNVYAVPDVTRWEYACLGTKASEREVELFSSWNREASKAFNEMPASWKNDCKELMIDLGLNKPISSAEFGKHAVNYLETAKAKDVARRTRSPKINALLHFALKSATPSLDLPLGLNLKKNEPELLINPNELIDYLDGVNTGSVNSWQIKHMHGNAAEWVIDIPNSNLESLDFIESLNQAWSGEAPAIPSNVNAAMAGGSACDTDWIAFAVGGGSGSKPLQDVVSRMIDPMSMAGLNFIRGVRVIRIVSLKPDWRRRERLQYLALLAKSDANLERQFAAWYDETRSLSSVDAEEIRKVVGAQASLLAAHGVKVDPKAKTLASVGKDYNDPYFGILGQVAGMDSK